MSSDQPEPKKIGRPRKYESDGKRPTLTFRARGSLYERLKDGATAGERSLSEEIEQRLEYSYELESSYEALRKYIDLIAGSGGNATDFIRHTSTVISASEQLKLPDGRVVGTKDWASSPETRSAINAGIKALVDIMAPVDEFEPLSLEDLKSSKLPTDELHARAMLPSDVMLAGILGTTIGRSVVGQLDVASLRELLEKSSPSADSKE